MSKNILVVDDDPHIREVIRFALEKAGMRVKEAANGVDALSQMEAERPDLLILDIVMPQMDGLEVCRTLRKRTEVPIIFLSSRDEELDRIIGLEVGGDDYVTKPFSPRELVARVNVILKRLTKAETLNHENGQAHKSYQVGQLRLDVASHQAFWGDEPVILTATEFRLLETFMRHPSRVYSREDLMNAYSDEDLVNDRTIDSHIRRVRHKFNNLPTQALIETVHGVGYKLGACQ